MKKLKDMTETELRNDRAADRIGAYILVGVMVAVSIAELTAQYFTLPGFIAQPLAEYMALMALFIGVIGLFLTDAALITGEIRLREEIAKLKAVP